MAKKHLSRLNAPKCWPIKKKQSKWITRPNPGPHPLKRGIPLSILIKDILKYAETTKQVKKILGNKEILIDKKARKDCKFPIGLMDTIEIPKTKGYYRIILNKNNKLIVTPIKKEGIEIKPCKIIGKKILKNKKTQLNLFDGRNILIDNDNYKVGDTIILNLSNNKIESHLKLEKDSKVYLMSGNHVGKIAIVSEFKKDSKNLTLDCNKQEIKTAKNYAFVIGDILKEYEK